MKISFDEKKAFKKGVMVVAVAEGKPLPADILNLDKMIIETALTLQDFTGKEGQTCTITLDKRWLILVGIGKNEEAQNIGGVLAQEIKKLKKKEVFVSVAGLPHFDLAKMAFGVGLGLYCFDVYKTKKDENKPENICFLTDKPEQLEKQFEPLFALMDGIFEARDLVFEPANHLSPAEFVEAVKEMKMKNVKISVLNKKQMEKMGMNLILAVGKGAQNEPYLLTLEYMNGPKNEAPVLLVGKGVCFDSGGMNLKPSQHLTTMGTDMAGAAGMVGTILALSKMGAKKNVVAVMPLVENMLSGTAQHTDDVVCALSGKTVEVGNTDAEGRLILADALWYGQEKYTPRVVIDMATLTGAIVVALGSTFAGLFSNDEKLVDALKKASEKGTDKVWYMPIHPQFDKMISSSIADIKNISNEPGAAGSATAACFLKAFIKEGTPWAHLDIAGTAWTKKESPCLPAGATGFGVQILTRYILEN